MIHHGQIHVQSRILQLLTKPPGCGGPLVVASAMIRALSQRKKNNQDQLLVNLNGLNQSGVERFSLKDLQVATDDFSPNSNIRHESEKKNLGIDLNKLEIFSLEDLQVATDKFSHKNIIGRGGSGAVYKGRLSDGSLVAIKRLSIKCTQSVVEFQTEVEMISRAVHRKLLRPHGYFSTPEERILVYPFMHNGSVASCLFASGSTRTQSQQTKAQSQASKESARIYKQIWLEGFSLDEIINATNGFNLKFILGEGAFGNVYEGKLPNGRVVAIKRQALKDKKTHTNKKHNLVGELQFKAEIELIGKAIHRNLLRLLGFCETPTERILVYPFMVNGSVASWLKVRDGAQPLSWEIRKKIAVGAANGLAYLHDDCEPKIIHRDVKAANILLDENFEAKVADFELVKYLESEDTCHHRCTWYTGIYSTRVLLHQKIFYKNRCLWIWAYTPGDHFWEKVICSCHQSK